MPNVFERLGLRGGKRTPRAANEAEAAEAETAQDDDEEEEQAAAESDSAEAEAESAQDDDDEDGEEEEEMASGPAEAARAEARVDRAVLSLPADHRMSGANIAHHAAVAERARIGAIVGCKAAKGRESAALELALSGLEVKAARAVLTTLPKNGRSLDDRMSSGRQPDLGPGGRSGGSRDTARAGWDKAAERINKRRGLGGRSAA